MVSTLPQSLLQALMTALPGGVSESLLHRAAHVLMTVEGLASCPDALDALAAELIALECGWVADDASTPAPHPARLSWCAKRLSGSRST